MKSEKPEEISALLQKLYGTNKPLFYDCMEKVVDNAHHKYRADDPKNKYVFCKDEQKVNLIAIRGISSRKGTKNNTEILRKLEFVEPSKRSNKFFDDTMFVVFKKDGIKHVHEFALSTEHGQTGNKIIGNGQYLYQFKNHNPKNYGSHTHLSKGAFTKNTHYRALSPVTEGVNCHIDIDVDGVVDFDVENEAKFYSLKEMTAQGIPLLKSDGGGKNNKSINIHYGGSEISSTARQSEGCQVIWNWQDYKDFIKLVESDVSIIGSINNELAPVPPKNGTRDVVYTIVDVEDLLYVIDRINPAVFPISTPGSAFNPIKYYHLNEMNCNAVGGYYGIGLSRNIHGGVHIQPDDKKRTQVRCAVDGYVVAARLPVKNTDGDSSDLKNLIRNNTGMVLVRHEFTERKSETEETTGGKNTADGTDNNTSDTTAANTPSSETEKKSQAEERHVFYSLYMHLAPVNGTDYKDNVVWCKKLEKHRYGALIPFPIPGNESTMVWLKEPFANGKEKLEVWDHDPITHKSPSSPWFFKPPFAAYDKLLDKLGECKLVTFTEPYIQIPAGSVIGYVEQPAGLSPQTPIEFTIPDAESGSPKKMQGIYGEGFLHWELFAPVVEGGKNGIEKLIDLFKTDTSLALPLIEESKGNEDNFWDVSEINSTIANAITDPAVKDKFTSMFTGTDNDKKKFDFRPKMLSMFHDSSLFAKECDLSEEINEIEPPDPEIGMYYLDLTIDCTGLLPPHQNGLQSGNTYELVYSYAKNKADGKGTEVLPGKWKITIDSIDTNSIPLKIGIPSNADTIEIKCAPESSGIEMIDSGSLEIDLQHMKDMLNNRLRNAQLRHHNEWTKTAANQLTTVLKSGGIKHPGFDKLDALAWWDESPLIGKILEVASDVLLVSTVPATAPIVIGKAFANAMSDKPEQKLFDGTGTVTLPTKGKIDNLHPVTALMMINQLVRNQKINLCTTWPKVQFNKCRDGVYSWVIRPVKEKPVVGDLLSILVLDDDYDYNSDDTLIQIFMQSGGTKISFGKFTWQNGGYCTTIKPMTFWGNWKCVVGAEHSPFVPLQKDSTAIALKKPEFASAKDQKKEVFCKKSDGHIYWLIALKDYAPVMLDGFVSLMLKTAKTNFTEKSFLPVTATSLATVAPYEYESEIFKVHDNCICGLTNDELIKTIQNSPSSRELIKGVKYDTLLDTRLSVKFQVLLIGAIENLRSIASNGIRIIEISHDGKTALCSAKYTLPKEEKSKKSTVKLKKEDVLKKCINDANVELFGKMTPEKFSTITYEKFESDSSCLGIRLSVKVASETCTVTKAAKTAQSTITKNVNGTRQTSSLAIPFGEINRAMEQPIATNMVQILELMKKNAVKFSNLKIDISGYVFTLTSETKNCLTVLQKAEHVYDAKSTGKNSYEVTVMPPVSNAISLSFNPSSLLNNALSSLSPGIDYECCYRFTAVNGLRYIENYSNYFTMEQDGVKAIDSIKDIANVEKIGFTSATTYPVKYMGFEDLKFSDFCTSAVNATVKMAGDESLWAVLKTKFIITIDSGKPKEYLSKSKNQIIPLSLNSKDVVNKSLQVKVVTEPVDSSRKDLFLPEKSYGPYALKPEIRNANAVMKKRDIIITADFFGIPKDKDFCVNVFNGIEELKSDTFSISFVSGRRDEYARCNSDGKFIVKITLKKDVTATNVKISRISDKVVKDNSVHGVSINPVTITIRNEA